MKRYSIVIMLSVPVLSYSQLHIGNGTSWRSNSGTYVVLNNTGIKYDAATALLDNIFKFTGSTDAVISGNNTPIFTQLQVAKTNPGKLILQRDINIFQSVAFQSGLFDLTNYYVNLGTAASVTGENETTRFIGNNGEIIIIPTITSAPLGVNPGNLGARITTSANLGTVIIRRGHKSQTSNGAGSSILRYYNIEPANNTGLNATLRFHFLEAELNSLLESSLVMWKSNNNVVWQNMGFTSRNTISNWVELTGINDFSRWTLSSPGNPLPVHWNSFAAVCNGDHVTVSWKTLQESNSQSFIIERSGDAVTWTSIGIVAAAGNSSHEIIYRFKDIQPLTSVSLYRIKQKDIDGSFSYSPILSSNCLINDRVRVYPTVTENMITITPSKNDRTNKMTLRIFDTGGKLLSVTELPCEAQQLSLAHLPVGLYLLETRIGQNVSNTRIVRQ